MTTKTKNYDSIIKGKAFGTESTPFDMIADIKSKFLATVKFSLDVVEQSKSKNTIRFNREWGNSNDRENRTQKRYGSVRRG